MKPLENQQKGSNPFHRYHRVAKAIYLTILDQYPSRIRVVSSDVRVRGPITSDILVGVSLHFMHGREDKEDTFGAYYIKEIKKERSKPVEITGRFIPGIMAREMIAQRADAFYYASNDREKRVKITLST